ncbi:MAG TPA: DUF6132 family protein [Planctomycetota bacterium]|nr:DUF6132 family protein [Planctomycetota bacterium]
MLPIAIGAVAGAVVGGVIGYLGHCRSGTCPLTSNPYMGAIYGAIVGALIASMFRR